MYVNIIQYNGTIDYLIIKYLTLQNENKIFGDAALSQIPHPQIL